MYLNILEEGTWIELAIGAVEPTLLHLTRKHSSCRAEPMNVGGMSLPTVSR